jgi:hypothetical protein
MDARQAKQTLDKIIGQIFGYQNPLTLEQAISKFAFDIRLPQQVYDATTNEPTWAASVNPTRFITLANMKKRIEVDDWMLPTRKLDSLQDVIAAWAETNYTTTERQIESTNVFESDSIYNSENVYRSIDVTKSKNVLFSDGIHDSECIAAGQRSNTSNYSIRVEDSQNCSNSFNVIWSSKITNCMFVQDCFDLYECMFCSHIAGKKYCIANMQFEEEEYMKIKAEVVRWVLTP